MDFKEIITKTRQIKRLYDKLNYQENYKSWGISEYTQGLVGDVGDLTKLIMAKKGLRFAGSDVDEKIKQELSDCLLSILIIADELKIDMENEFIKTIEHLQEKINGRKILRNKKLGYRVCVGSSPLRGRGRLLGRVRRHPHAKPKTHCRVRSG